jgi:hypothetical protein
LKYESLFFVKKLHFLVESAKFILVIFYQFLLVEEVAEVVHALVILLAVLVVGDMVAEEMEETQVLMVVVEVEAAVEDQRLF